MYLHLSLSSMMEYKTVLIENLAVYKNTPPIWKCLCGNSYVLLKLVYFCITSSINKISILFFVDKLSGDW